jgi:hypothetical protein
MFVKEYLIINLKFYCSMKKVLLLFVSLLVWTAFVSAQTVLYTDNLDSYPNQSYLGVDNPTWWTTWENLPGTNQDIQISTNFAHSSPNSGQVDVTSGTSTDGILKLGDKVSGVYELTWWLYISNNKCGYYNVQHFESPGIEWAFEIYFRANGDIHLLEGGNTINGTYPKATWFECKQQINLDADSIYLYVNGTLLQAWTFSDQANVTGGTKQLGGVDFYAGAEGTSGETPEMFIDDIYFAQLQAGNDPNIQITPNNYTTVLVGGTNGQGTLSVANIGLSDLTYNVNITYNVDAMKSAQDQTKTNNTPSMKKTISLASADPTPNPVPYPGTDATAQLHYDGDNYTAVGWNTVPVNVTVAAKFLNSMTLPYAGMVVSALEVFINDLNTGSNNMVAKIYGMGSNTYEPGDLLYSQAFTPTGASWNTINLTTPVPVTGEDLWVGYNFTQTTASIYIPGADAGPANPNGDFVSTGVGWSHIAPTLDYNWNIRADLTGNPITQWLTVTPMSGTITPGNNDPILLQFSTTNLALGTYVANVKFISNDPDTAIYNVPVTLVVVGVGIPQNEKLGVMIYPNPAQDVLNIQTDGRFSSAEITDFSGKTVAKSNSPAIDIRGLSNGVYFVKITTNEGVVNTKFIKK